MSTRARTRRKSPVGPGQPPRVIYPQNGAILALYDGLILRDGMILGA